MTPETEAKLERVRKYSTSLRRVFNFFRFILAIASLVALLIVLTRGTSEASASFAFFGREFSGGEISWTLKILVVIWVLIVFGVAQKFLGHLAALFDLYAQGRIFTADNVYQIRQIGISVFLFCLGSAYSIVARIILLAIGHPLGASPPAADSISLSFDGPLNAILAGTIIIVISWIMDVGREMREESDLTV